MGVSEIQSSINNLNNKVKSLGNLKIDYQNMNNQINKVITELSAAYISMDIAKIKFSESYQSETANKKVKDFEEQETKINELIEKLRNEILVESNRRITSINSDIQQTQQSISTKNRELQAELNKDKS